MPHPHWTVHCMFIARGWVLNPLQGECWKILSLGIGLENPVSRDRIGQYYPASRDRHQIHPRRVERIDSVKINPSLVMMREWHTSQNTGKVELVPHSLWKLWAEKLWHRGHLFFRWHGENRRKNETRSQYCRDQQQIQTNTGGPRDFSPRSQQAARCCENLFHWKCPISS